MSKFLIIAVVALLSMSANAAKIEYVVVSGASGNQYTAGGGGFYGPDSPLAAADGAITYNPDNGLAVGTLGFTNIFEGSGQSVNQVFNASIGINMSAGGDLALFGNPDNAPGEPTCFDLGTTPACGDLLASVAVLDNNVISVLSGDLAAGGDVTIKWLIGGAPGASSFNTFTLTQVPVPAAVWLFGSGLGLLGWMRRKA